MLLLIPGLALAAPVTLLSSGEEPRSPARYRWVEGRTQQLELTTTSRNVVVLGGLLPDPDPFDTRQRATWTAAVRGASLVLELLSASASTDGPQPAPDLAPLAGLTATLEIDDRGSVSGARWITPPGLSEQQQQRAEGLRASLASVVPLPAEAVGPGARWQVIDQEDSAGMTLRVVSTYVLEAREGDTLTLALSIALDAPPAEVSLPGFVGKVRKLTFVGSQQLTLDLSEPIPERSGSNQVHLDMKGKKAMLPVSMVLDVDQQIHVR